MNVEGCWRNVDRQNTEARGEEPVPAPLGVSALGRCQTSWKLIFNAASEMRFGPVNFMNHGIGGVLLIKQNISFFPFISRKLFGCRTI
jgi:hypothetical protein